MKQIITKSLRRLLVVPMAVLIVGFAGAPAVGAVVFDKGLAEGAQSAQGKDQQGTAACLFGSGNGCDADNNMFKTVTNVLLFIIGAIAVIMLVIGGIKYTTSNGDQAAVQSAKNTILYAVVGIIVAILAYAIVTFVVSSFSGSAG